MGKSTVAAMLRRLRIATYCADEAVHALFAAGGDAVQAVGTLFPAAMKKDTDGRVFIDRAMLGQEAFHQPELMRRLEAIVHPKVRQAEKKFLARARRQRRGVVVLDIPLLLETGGQKRVDAVWVVSAPPFIQRQRVLARHGMSQEKFAAILKRQMPDARKRKYADTIIATGLNRAFTFRAIKRALIMGTP